MEEKPVTVKEEVKPVPVSPEISEPVVVSEVKPEKPVETKKPVEKAKPEVTEIPKPEKSEPKAEVKQPEKPVVKVQAEVEEVAATEEDEIFTLSRPVMEEITAKFRYRLDCFHFCGCWTESKFGIHIRPVLNTIGHNVSTIKKMSNPVTPGWIFYTPLNSGFIIRNFLTCQVICIIMSHYRSFVIGTRNSVIRVWNNA